MEAEQVPGVVFGRVRFDVHGMPASGGAKGLWGMIRFRTDETIDMARDGNVHHGRIAKRTVCRLRGQQVGGRTSLYTTLGVGGGTTVMRGGVPVVFR